MKQTRLGWLWTWLNWSNNTSQMRQCCEKASIPFQHLSNSRSNDLASHWFPPIPSRQRVSKSHSDCSRVEDQLNTFIKIMLSWIDFSSYDLFPVLNITIFELIFEKISHQHSSHIKSFFSIVISVIFISFSQESVKQLPHHVANEIGLFNKAVTVSSNVRKHLFHEQISDILNNCGLVVHPSQFINIVSDYLQALLLAKHTDLFNRVSYDFEDAFEVFNLAVRQFEDFSLADTVKDIYVSL